MHIRSARLRATARFAALSAALFATSAPAALYTVGTGGTHATVAAAVQAALSTPEDDEIRVQAGVFPENFVAGGNVGGKTVLSGGWDTAFEARAEDPSLTVIDGGLIGRTMEIMLSAGEMSIENLSIVRGRFPAGGAIQLLSYNDAVLSISDCVIRDSVAFTENVAEAGGASLASRGTSTLRMSRCSVHDNLSQSPTYAAHGGLVASALDTSTIEIVDTDVFDNRVDASTNAYSGGMGIFAFHGGRVVVRDARVESNSVEADSAVTASGVYVTNMFSTPGTPPSIELRRLSVIGNGAVGPHTSPQLSIDGNDAGVITVGDTLVADGIGSSGIATRRAAGLALRLVNVTAAGNVGTELSMVDGGVVSNSLVGSLQEILAPPTLVNTRVDPAPGYVDAAGGDYRLQLSSPAVGAGTLTPEGGLGDLDLDGNARRIGPGVDLGAYEADDPTLFFDDFES